MSTCSYSVYKKQTEQSLDLKCLLQEASNLLQSVNCESDTSSEEEDECPETTLKSVMPKNYANKDPWMIDVLESSSSSSEEETNESLKLDLMMHKVKKSYRDFATDFLQQNCNKYHPYMLSKSSMRASPSNEMSLGQKKMLKDSRLKNLAIKRKTRELELMRKKMWKHICKKEIPKCYKLRVQTWVSKLSQLRKVSQQATKRVRAKALESRQLSKREVILSRAKRISREAQFFWKKYVKVEKTQKKRAEKQALVQKKIDFEMQQASEQKQKLNFLITQVELYAHLTASDMEEGTKGFQEKQKEILSNLSYEDGIKNITEKVGLTAHNAMQKVSLIAGQRPSLEKNSTVYPQPSMFNGTLSEYQVKGLNWLATLYNNHLNGILADDMGLGKTVQAIAFLAHLAERHKVWGPFLVVAPSSTLNNWHQEFTKFLPDFKILPYWGNISQRRDLRLYWSHSNMSSSDSAPFHALVTSYQLILSDVSYFEKINWQYIILDEAQALKSSNSLRWKTLLNFRCRNRLLLTGTPVQNTMAELWSLLHFIMPALFDSQAEFHEWFSRDIENHIENKAKVDQLNLQRLHMVLKPFILRRLKSEVKNELSAKVEVKVVCYLSPRQKLLYENLQKNLNVASFLSENVASRSLALYNLVMQFRKVCNHPDLFHERRPKSSLFGGVPILQVSRLVYNEFIFPKGKSKLLYTDMNIHNPNHISACIKNDHDSSFSFLRFADLSVGEYDTLFNNYSTESVLAFVQMQTVKSILNNLRWNFCDLFDSIPSFHLCSLADKAAGIDTSLLHQVFNITSKNFFAYASACIKQYVNSNSEQSVTCNKVVKKVIKEVPTRVPQAVQDIFLPPAVYVNRELYCSHFAFYPSKVTTAVNNVFNTQSKVFVNFISRDQLIIDSAKLHALDQLLNRLKSEGHRVLIYSQMTKMIDILEDYMVMRKFKYLRVDGSSAISSRRDKVADFQTSSDIFAFLLSTRAGGVGINLTAADTVIFYDSDWNPSMDQQAMDRAHRLGQKKQVTVYRLVCKDTVDEKILQRAEEKNIIQKMVISGDNSGLVRPSEVVSLLVNDKRIIEEVMKQDQKQKGRCKRQGKVGQNKCAANDAFDFSQMEKCSEMDSRNSSPVNSPSCKPSSSKRGRPRVRGGMANVSGVCPKKAKMRTLPNKTSDIADRTFETATNDASSFSL